VGFRIKESGFNVKKYISLNKIRGEEPHLSKLRFISHSLLGKSSVYADHFALLPTKSRSITEKGVKETKSVLRIVPYTHLSG
jgi:hypothetical protein